MFVMKYSKHYVYTGRVGIFKQNKKRMIIRILYAESISAWSNQGSVMCLLSILNKQK